MDPKSQADLLPESDVPLGKDESRRRIQIYEAVLSTTPDLVYVFGLDHRFLYANAALLAMWGKTWAESIGKNCLELGYEPWHAEMHGREIEQVVATGEPIRGEVPFNGTNGLRIYDYIFTPVFGPDGKVAAVAGTTRDVTERKKDEQRTEFLAELTRRITLLPADQNPLAMTAEMVGKFLGVAHCVFGECSPGLNRVTVTEDWSRDGQSSIGGDHVLFDFGDKAWWADYSRGGYSVDDVATHPQTRDRAAAYHHIRVRSYASQTRALDNERVLMLAATDDAPRTWAAADLKLLDDVLSRLWPVVEKSRMEAELRQQSQRLSLLWNAAAILLKSEDPETMLQQIFDTIREPLGLDVYINFMAKDGMLRLSSYRGLQEEDVGEIGTLDYGQAICGTVAATGRAIVANHLQGGCDPKAGFVRGMGLKAYLCNPLMAGNHLLGTLSFGSRTREAFSEEEARFIGTITHYVTAAYVRLRLMDNLRDWDRKKDHFLATLAHELRNPIAPILTGLDVIRSSADRPETVGKVAAMMRRQTGQMVHLIDDLLELSRITTGKFVLRPEKSDLHRLVTEAVEVIRPLIDQNGQTLILILPDEGLALQCDPHRISQVVSNLLLNATKYTPRGGNIGVTVERGLPDGARIRVVDDGIGIEASAQSRIFDMFEQEDTSRTDGLGIGLTLVKTLVEMHGGTVTLKSGGKGQGSEFVVELPGILRSTTGPSADGAAGVAPEIAKGRILIVDDERTTAQVLEMMLQADGLETAVAYDGIEALERAEHFQPDLVFMDLGMPRLDGYQAAAEMKKRHPHVRLVALSGWGRDEDRQRSAASGFDGHMVKPASPEDIRSFLGWLGDGRPSGEFAEHDVGVHQA